MKKTTFIISLLLLALCPVFGQQMYVKTFGKQGKPSLVFLHGGPGYNCANFEYTTAQQLANAGFFVMVYDRRGEGRSDNEKAKFTFEETLTDLNNLFSQFNIKQATLLGHSFGGLVATRFAEKFPKKTKAVVLIGSPVVFQETFLAILNKVKKIYEAKQDKTNLRYVAMLEKMDKKSLQYSSYCFVHAMQNGFYTPKKMTEEAKSIYAQFKTNESLGKYAKKMGYAAPQGFWKNEQYTSIDLTKSIEKLTANKLPVFGLYGKEDGLFSSQQVENLAKIIGRNNLLYLDNCSHNVFIDQQKQFIKALKKWVK